MRRTAWKRLIAQREGDENWVLGRVLFASFIVSSAASQPILLHTCCDCAFGDNVEFHNIKLPVVSGRAGGELPTDTPPICPLCRTCALFLQFVQVCASFFAQEVDKSSVVVWPMEQALFILPDSSLQAINASNILSIFISKCELD